MDCVFARRRFRKPITVTQTFIPVSYTAIRANITNASNAYADTSNTTYAQVTQSGSGGDGFFMLAFDFSSIPNNAVIDSVIYKIKAQAQYNRDNSYVYGWNESAGIYYAQKTITSAATVYTWNDKTFTRAQLNDFKAVTGVESGKTARTYGAEMVITYTY